MSSYNYNSVGFGTLQKSQDVEDNNNANSNAVIKKNQEIEQIKNSLLHGRSSTAFSELFEDLHRYIQQEQNSSLPNQVAYTHSVAPMTQSEYQYNTLKPVQNINQLPLNTNLPVPYNPTQVNQRDVVHRAHISLVPSANGIIKTITKRKRKRTIFTTNQVEELEKYFSKKPYVTREERQVLVNRLNVADKAVKIWFQNRRLKNKRDHYESASETVMEVTNVSDFQLNYVESQINEKTDKNGYVMLDDAIMGNLANIIDSCLSNTTVERIDESSTESESSPIYEPISPPDSTQEDDTSLWQPQEPAESLQRLLDIQNIIY